MFSHSVVSDSLQPHGTPPGFLCPWGFSRQEYWSGLPCPPPGDLLNPGIEPRSPALWVDSLLSEPPQKPKNTGVDIYPFSRGSSQPRNWTRVSCIAGGFFTSWATREAWIKAKHLKIVTKLWHRMIPCQHGWAINTSQYFAPGNWHCSFYPIWWLQLLTTVAVTITYYLREGRVMGERNINPTANQPVSPGLESKSTARECWSQDHTSVSCSTEAEKVSTPMSNVEFIIFPLIFTLYFISLSVITSQLFTYITNLKTIIEFTPPFLVITGLIYQSS